MRKASGGKTGEFDVIMSGTWPSAIGSDRTSFLHMAPEPHGAAATAGRRRNRVSEEAGWGKAADGSLFFSIIFSRLTTPLSRGGQTQTVLQCSM